MSFLEDFTNKQKYQSLLNNVSGSRVIKLNNKSVPIKDGKRVATDAFNSAVGSIDKALNVSKYTVPTKLALDSFNKMGKDIDETLKSAFLLQTFHVKGTDILCAAFCFLLSLLSCSQRDDLYKALKNFDKATQAVNSGVKAANQIVDTIGVTMASADAIISSANSIFGKSPDGGPNKVQAAAMIAAAPITIVNNAKKIGNALKLGLNFKMMMPDVLGKGVWDLAATILSMLQHMAVQMADEALSKLIKPVEDMLRRITPSICYGTMATRLQQQIIQTLKSFKSKILAEIADALSSNMDFNAKMRAGISQSATTLQLLAFADALRIIGANFFEIARSCGVSPCSNEKPKDITLSDIGNLDDYYVGNASTLPAYFPDMVKFPKATNQMDKLAEKLAPSLGLDKGNVYITPQEVLGVYKVADGAPSKILELINNGALNNILDDNYAVYKEPDNGVKVVYRYNRNCGD